MKCHFILYVADQAVSTEFYAVTLGMQPTLNTPGMTEFHISDYAVLGLMPFGGVKRLFANKIQLRSRNEIDPFRCEVYLVVPDAAHHHALALSAGAKELSQLAKRDWGPHVAYSLDPDGHVLAFAED